MTTATVEMNGTGHVVAAPAAKTEAAVVVRPPISDAEAEELFKTWSQADKLRDSFREEVRLAEVACTAACNRIAEKLGPGMYEYEGRKLTLAKVKGSDVNHTLREQSVREVKKIG